MAIARATTVMLLAGPTVLALFAGGYYDRPRLWAGLLAWLAVVVAALVAPRPLPRSRGAWLALGGLAALTAWTAASISWAPLRDVAQADAQRLVLYLGVFVAAAVLLRSRSAGRAAEPVLALGTLVVIAEGLSERLLPAQFALERSQVDPGRLTQPLTYWNAEGLVAAAGFVLCARLAGDPMRTPRVRFSAAAAAPVLATGLQLTLSRGAILAAVVGLTLLAVLAPTRAQARALLAVLAASAPAILAGALLPGVRALEGSEGAREWQGLVMLAVLLLAALIAVGIVEWGLERPGGQRVSREVLRIARPTTFLVALGTVAVFVVLAAQRGASDVNRPAEVSAARLGSVESVRGEFWRVAAGTWADHPLVGAGSGGYGAEWLQRREIRYSARDAHSLYLETLAELGIIGLLALGAFGAGVALCARRLLRGDPGLAAGPVAVLAAWAVAAGLDWHWEMPAVALVAILLAGLVVGGADALDSAWIEEDAEPRRRRGERRTVELVS